jgi:hypothetical protein
VVGAAVLLLLGMLLARWPASRRERAGWLADHDALTQFLGEGYANLRDRLRTVRVRPLHLETRAALAGARTLDEARKAEEAFVAAFHDPHFRVDRVPGVWKALAAGGGSAGAPLLAAMPAAEACARMGFAGRDRGLVAWSALPGWRTVGGGTAGAPLEAGVVETAGAPTLGILRIPIFSAEGFPALCEERWRQRQARAGEPCDGPCQEGIGEEAERDLVERMAEQLAALRAAGAQVLLVDVTGNGGGSGVADPMARQLTEVPLRTAEMGFVRHPHWESQFASAADRFREELRRVDLPPTQRETLERALRRSTDMQREASARCDLSGIWEGGEAELPCDPVVRFEGYVRHARPGELDGLETRGLLFGASQYPYREGAWSGPLLVLVDRRTASSSEMFAALLRDNGAARVLGERTMGAGCGYTEGGLRLDLPHLGLRVRVPDCTRHRADGRNELDGIAPDEPVSWQGADDAPERARKALAAALSSGIGP